MSAAAELARLAVQAYAHEELGALFKEGLAARTTAIAEGGRELSGLLAATHASLRIGRAAPAWRAYVDSIGALVLGGLTGTVLASSAYLAMQAGRTVTRTLLTVCMHRPC